MNENNREVVVEYAESYVTAVNIDFNQGNSRRQAELVESIQRALDYMIIVESYDVSATPVVTCLIDLLDHMNVMAEGTRPLRAGRPHVSIEEEQLEFVIEAGFPAGERYSFNVLLFKKNH